MTENNIVKINPAEYGISAEDMASVGKAGIHSVHIISFTPEYFSQAPKYEVMQGLSVSESGHIIFDAYKAGDKFGALTNVRKINKEIGVANAGYIFHFVLQLLEKEHYKSLEPRPGCWQAVIDYTNGERRNFYGPYYDETLVAGVDVNEFIKDIVQIDNTNLFGRIDPLLQLEQCVETFSEVTVGKNLEDIFKALQYCFYKNVFIDTMLHGVGENNNAGGLGIAALKLEDGEQAIVAMTSGERCNALPATYFSMPFADLCRYTMNQEVVGLFVNPGSQNFMIPKEMLQTIIDSMGMES